MKRRATRLSTSLRLLPARKGNEKTSRESKSSHRISEIIFGMVNLSEDGLGESVDGKRDARREGAGGREKVGNGLLVGHG